MQMSLSGRSTSLWEAPTEPVLVLKELCVPALVLPGEVLAGF